MSLTNRYEIIPRRSDIRHADPPVSRVRFPARSRAEHCDIGAATDGHRSFRSRRRPSHPPAPAGSFHRGRRPRTDGHGAVSARRRLPRPSRRNCSASRSPTSSTAPPPSASPTSTTRRKNGPRRCDKSSRKSSCTRRLQCEPTNRSRSHRPNRGVGRRLRRSRRSGRRDRRTRFDWAGGRGYASRTGFTRLIAETASPWASASEKQLALALEIDARRVLLDDGPARRLAIRLGLPVMGTGGVLIVAKQRGILSAVRPVLDELLATGFRLRWDVRARGTGGRG